MEALVIADIEEFNDAPRCNDCGAVMHSSGLDWRCIRCGYRRRKVYRVRRKGPPRPVCPRCGSAEIISRSPDWRCKACGRTINKNLAETTCEFQS